MQPSDPPALQAGSTNASTAPQLRSTLAPTAPGPKLALLALIAWVAVAVASVVFRVTGGAPLQFDAWVHQHVWAAPHSTSASIALQLAALGSSVGAATLGVLAAIICLVRNRWQDATILALSMLLGVGSSQLLKWVSQRPRPLDLGAAIDGASFPSGHSMGAAVLATALALIVWSATSTGSPWRPVALTLAGAWIIAMMWSRIALHVHWFTDTVGGLLLGSSVAILTRYGWQQLRRHQRSRVESKP